MTKNSKSSKTSKVETETIQETVQPVTEAVQETEPVAEEAAPTPAGKVVRPYEPDAKLFRVVNPKGETIQLTVSLKEFCRSFQLSYSKLYGTLKTGRALRSGWMAVRDFEYTPNATCLVRKPRRCADDTEETYAAKMAEYTGKLAAMQNPEPAAVTE